MKENYQNPEMELVEFPDSDVITTSRAATGTDPTVGPEPGDEWL